MLIRKRCSVGLGSPSCALRSARDKWNGNDFLRGEGDDPYYERCFGTLELEKLFDRAFVHAAETVFTALMEHAEAFEFCALSHRAQRSLRPSFFSESSTSALPLVRHASLRCGVCRPRIRINPSVTLSALSLPGTAVGY